MNNPEEVTALENAFAEEVKKRGDDFKFFKDQVYKIDNEINALQLKDVTEPQFKHVSMSTIDIEEL